MVIVHPQNRWPRMNITDVLLGCWMLYLGLHTVVVREGVVDPHTILRMLALLSGYLLFRAFPNDKIISNALIYGGVLQCLLLIMQHFGILISSNQFFPLTGSFHNPAMTATFLALGVVAGIHEFINFGKSIKYLILTGATFVFLVLAGSRAAQF